MEDSNEKPKLDKTAMLEMLQKNHLLFHDTNGEPYIAVDKTGVRVIPIESKRFTKWLSAYLRKTYDRTDVTRGFLEEVAFCAAAIAEDDESPTIQLGVRLSREDDENGLPKRISYDLRNGKIVKIMRGGWVYDLKPKVEFYQYPHQHPQVEPAETGLRQDLKDLRQFVRVSDDDEWLLFQVLAVSLFVPSYPKPIVSVTGDMGAGKTETLRTLCKLLDPSDLANGVTVTYKADDFMRRCIQNAVLFIDNADYLGNNLMSTLCVLSTGGTFEARLFYTNTGSVSFYLQRPVLISSIPSVGLREDMLDRMFTFRIKRIPENERKPQGELNKAFELAKPQILGNIFLILGKALETLPSVRLDKLERMADFQKLGYAIAESIDGYTGEDFLRALRKMRKRQEQYLLDASPVAQAARYLVSKTGTWFGTPTEFYTFTTPWGKSEDDQKFETALLMHPKWPNNIIGFGKAFERCRTTIEALGISVKSGHHNGQRYIELCDLNYQHSLDAKTNVTNKKEGKNGQ